MSRARIVEGFNSSRQRVIRADLLSCQNRPPAVPVSLPVRILYIDIDCLRPDHLGCYGYSRNTSPAIDGIARDGVRFNQCYTPDAPCLPSRTALYSGRLGIQSGVVGHGGTGAEPKRQGPTHRGFRDLFDQQGLAVQLQTAGFHTSMISPFGQRHAAHWFCAGFHEIHNTGHGGMESAEEIMPFVRRWMENRGTSDDWFLHLNLWDPHTPYRVPLDFGHPFADSPLPGWLQDPAVLERHQQMTGPHTALDVGMFTDGDPDQWPREPRRIDSPAALKQWIDGYDTGIRYADDHLAWIVAELKRLGIYDATGIIVSADHGENQGELGIYGEHATADEATCHIPLIIKWPGAQPGARDDGFHLNIDLAPTLMDLLGRPSCPIWDGQSFAGSVVSGTGPSAGREEVVLSQCAHVLQRSVRCDRWLYLRTYHCGFHLFPPEMLFDLETDPHEQNDLAGVETAVCHEGAWRLARWHDEQMQKMAEWCTDIEDPLWRVAQEGGPFHARHAGNPDQLPLRAYLKRLEATGRAAGACALRKKYGRFLP